MDRPDGNFVVGTLAGVILLLAVIASITFTEIEGDKREIEIVKLCHEQNKEVKYRETGRAIYSECE